MNKRKKSLKEEAQQALSRGELRKALECFKNHCAQDPEDLRSQLKVAELLERLDQKKEAIQMYQKVAEAYARDGFLLQAISINKMILRLDPSSKDVNDRLVQLYSERSKEMKPFRPFPHIPLFSELNEQELQSLLPHIQSKTFLKGSVICQEGEGGDSLFVISRGEVAIIKQTQQGKEVRIRNLREGDFFGEFGFFTDQKKLNEIIKISPHLSQVLQNFFKKRVLDLFLAFSPLFSSLTSEERNEILKRFRLHKVSENTLLFKGGDPPHSLYLIKSGEVEVFIQDRNKKKVSLGVLRSGNFFGEIGAVLGKPRMAFAKTTRPSELLELTKEDLETCLAQFPKLQTVLKEISMKRLVQMKELLSQEAVEKAKEAMV
jgi:CRP-like cAMP-binding protein